MVVGVGIDQVEIRRMAELLVRKPERAAVRLFTEAEREVCDRRKRPAECYAARFAAKEAFLKALGTGLTRGIGWHDVQVLVEPSHQPVLRLAGRAAEIIAERGVVRVHLSFTHEAGLATAVVILES